jgi:hypothetical protein
MDNRDHDNDAALDWYDRTALVDQTRATLPLVASVRRKALARGEIREWEMGILRIQCNGVQKSATDEELRRSRRSRHRHHVAVSPAVKTETEDRAAIALGRPRPNQSTQCPVVG